jgi:hypothetical protein
VRIFVLKSAYFSRKALRGEGEAEEARVKVNSGSTDFWFEFFF